MTYEHALYVLRIARKFEGSSYERDAMAVYEHGLFAPGVPVYASLDDAIAEARLDFERDLQDTARAIASGSLPANPWHIVAWNESGEREEVIIVIGREKLSLRHDEVVHWLGKRLEESFESDT